MCMLWYPWHCRNDSYRNVAFFLGRKRNFKLFPIWMDNRITQDIEGEQCTFIGIAKRFNFHKFHHHIWLVNHQKVYKIFHRWQYQQNSKYFHIFFFHILSIAKHISHRFTLAEDSSKSKKQEKKNVIKIPWIQFYVPNVSIFFSFAIRPFRSRKRNKKKKTFCAKEKE